MFITKTEKNIPKISSQQMQALLDEAPEVTPTILTDMLKEIPTSPWDAAMVEIALALVDAGRAGVPKLGPNGTTFVNLVVAWAPWTWEIEE